MEGQGAGGIGQARQAGPRRGIVGIKLELAADTVEVAQKEEAQVLHHEGSGGWWVEECTPGKCGRFDAWPFC